MLCSAAAAAKPIVDDFHHQNPEINPRQHYMECLKHNYDVILKKGAEQNPIPQKEQGKRGRVKRGKIRTTD